MITSRPLGAAVGRAPNLRLPDREHALNRRSSWLRFETPLVAATLVRRYKRFLADVVLADGREITVHCPNPGRMTACSAPGRPVLLSDSNNPRRKLRYSLEMIRMGRTWVGLNTIRANRTMRHFLEQRQIVELQGYTTLRTEVPFGTAKRSRVDFLLRAPGVRRDCYVEVKNTTYRLPGREGVAAFPDAVTLRGRKHLADLAEVARGGHRAVLLFHVGRNDVHRVRPADEVDPAYGVALRAAAAAGVEIVAYRVQFSPQGIALRRSLPVNLNHPS